VAQAVLAQAILVQAILGQGLSFASRKSFSLVPGSLGRPNVLKTRMEEKPDQASAAEGCLADALADFTNSSAFMIAYERALETERPDALISDPYAKLLKGSQGEALSEEFGGACEHFKFPGWPEFHKMWTAVRTKFIDDELTKATKSVSQVVNLGAGLDTRSLRLGCYKELEAAFEVDMEAVNKPKLNIMKKLGAEPLCKKVEIISMDFLDKEKSLKSELQTKGFDVCKPSAFVAEGLIQYLGEGKLKFLADVAVAAAVGSIFILQYLDDSAGGPPGSPPQGLSDAILKEQLGCDWSYEFHYYGDPALNFGRYDLERFSPSPFFAFMVATKQK